ncbi:MAG: anti-sigma factor antagonist [Firmicutes bacterium]|nr:anti-sigma factor antagonist [Bacillota bacterium]
MKIEHKIVNRTLYATLCGELDEHTAPGARATLDGCLANGGYSRIILELSGLGFMDSTGIGVLIGRYKKWRDQGIPIFIASPSRQADKVLSLSGIYQLMPKLNL